MAMLSKIKDFNCVADVTTVEAKACLQAVSVIEELGFRNLTVERDSLTVIKKSQFLEVDKSSIAVIIQEIKKRCRRFENITYSFAGRLANQAAHVLAEEGKNWAETRVWLDEALQITELAAERDKRFLSQD
ncbi:hypothetical protein CXB51_013622 [Gossypium anomalum]|uniref:RNase H type-1 domain-containing protein n=1 Tax=Gossypium anomalum TaxID=47600 RepID=A0A8J5Z2Z0_9ROSI|nr:hypothetical protein CXB51_013622 [Gossypium anomalum]